MDGTANYLIKHLGDLFFLKALGWSERNLRHAKSVGKISAQWREPIEEACLLKGIECPSSAFTSKTAAKNIGDWFENQEALFVACEQSVNRANE